MNGAPDVTLEGGYLPVNADLIEARLDEIWKEAAGAPDDLPLVKLCLANMLVVTDADSRTEAEHLAQQMAVRHPSRVLLIVIDQVLATYSSFVRTACEFNPDIGAYVCWEIVEVLSDTARSIQVAGAVRSLLVDSVPVVTVDLRKFQTTPGFDRDLHDMSDYYLVQAEVVPASAQFRGFMPLGWYRTLPIRELIGRVVGLIVQQKKSLTITSITLFYDDDRERLDPFLAGWFVGRMADGAIVSNIPGGVGFEYRGAPVELRWAKRAITENVVVRMGMGADDDLVVSTEPRQEGDRPKYYASHGELRITQPSAEPDLVSYLLATLGDEAEFREYAEVQRISTRLPIP